MSAGEVMTGAEMVIRAFQDQGVDTLFGYPGGAVLPIYDALFHQDSVKHILVRHEQGACTRPRAMPARRARSAACSSPRGRAGRHQHRHGLTDALLDSIPLVCITGQVPTHLIGSDAFQECDTVGITRSCTKHNYLVKSIEDLPRILHEAFYVASHGRPGPVVIDLPKDIQFASGVYRRPVDNSHKTYNPQTQGDPEKIRAAVALMAGRAPPGLLYRRRRHQCGAGGLRAAARARPRHRLPGHSTLMGLGAFPGSDPQFLGMLGMHGTYEANLAMHECDVMVCIGARFDDRITGRLDAFSPFSKKIHVDIDASSINKTVKADIGIVGDCGSVLADMLREWRP